MTWTRARDGRSATISTVAAMSRSRSSADRVGDSPVVPHGTRPSIPARTCQWTRRRKAASSSAPSVVNGVTRAVYAPRRMGRGIGVVPFVVGCRGCGWCQAAAQAATGRRQQLVDDGVEGVDAGRRAAPVRASRRRPGRRSHTRTGRAPSAGARPSRRRHRSRRGACRATRRPGSTRPRGRRSVRQTRVAGDHPAREVECGARTAGRPSFGGAIRRGTDRTRRRPEQLRRGLDEPAEQGHPEAEVGGYDRGRACASTSVAPRPRGRTPSRSSR